MSEPEILLEMADIQRAFLELSPGRGIVFLRKGQVHALVGENGAGKSTLVKDLAGALQPEGGTLSFHGQPVQFHDPCPLRSTASASFTRNSTCCLS
jgi:ABC-type sugar transport system ATPase subunit